MDSAPSDPRLVARLQSLSRLAAGIVIAVGCLVIIGWLFHIEPLKNVLPGLATMKFNTALAFTLAGIALFNLRSQPRITWVAAVTVIAVGGLTLSQYLFGWNLGIDQLFVQDASKPTLSSIPGRMSFITALNFSLIGSALLLTRPRHYTVAHSSTILASFFALLALLGYLYNIESLYRVFWFSSVALHTAVTFVVLCLGILIACPDQGFARILTVSSAGGYIARRLLPVVALISIGVGWLRWQGELRGLYGSDFGVALFTLSNLIILSAVIMHIAHTLHTTDIERRNALDALRQTRDELELRVQERTSELVHVNQSLEAEVTRRKAAEDRFRSLLESAPDALIISDEDGQIVFINTQTVNLFGYTRDELLHKPIEILIPEPFRSRHTAHRGGYVVDPHVRGMGIDLELYALRKDGNQFPVEISLSPIETETGLLIASAVRNITQRKQTEEALRRSEELYRTLARNFPNGAVLLFDHDLRYLLVDGVGLAEVGLSKENMEGKTIWEVFPPETSALIEPAYRAALTGEAVHTEVPYAERIYWVQHVPVTDSDGKVIAGMLMTQNITERKQMEAQIAKARDFYRTLLEAFPALIWQAGTDTLCHYFNRSWLEFTGRTLEQESGDGWTKGVHFDDLDRCLDTYLKSFEARQPFMMEYRLHHHSGSYRWIVDYGQPFLDLDGEFAGFIGACYDINERRQAEQALRESEERYRALFNEIEDAIFIHDQESNILDVNQAACDRLGYTRDELLRIKTTDIDAPDYGAKFYERLQRQLGTGKLLDIEGIHVAQDGHQIPVHVNSRKITYKGQMAVLAVARDVTELKRAEQQAVELVAEKTRVKLLAEFIRDISHDFRTPLTIIGSNAYLLFRTSDPEKQQRYFDGIQLQVKQMANLIERLLLMARLDALGSFDFQPMKVDSLMKLMEARFGHIAQGKGITLTLELPDVSPTIQADSPEIVQAVAEIVGNAIAFTPVGGAVTIRVSAVENMVVIAVQDTGGGIPPEDLPHIFKRLYRSDKARSTERGAAGLGLSIAERIVEGHGGHIQVESELGIGSTFSIYLPLSG